MDVGGEVLATSVQRYNVGVNQEKVAKFKHFARDEDGKLVRDEDGRKVLVGTGAAAAADLLAPILGRDPATGMECLRSSHVELLCELLDPRARIAAGGAA